MGLLKNILGGIKIFFGNGQKALPESSEAFFKRIFGLEEVDDIRVNVPIEDYNRIVGRERKSVDIKCQITQEDLKRIIRERSELTSLSFYGIDISGLDLSVLEQLESLKTISYISTKFDKNPTRCIPSNVVSCFFRDIDFSENPVILPNHKNITVSIERCSNISKIQNLNKLEEKLEISKSDISDIFLDFPNLKCLNISHCTSGKIESLEEIARKFPSLRILYLVGQPIKKLANEKQEGVKFENLEYLGICYSPDFTEFGSGEGMFPKVKELNCQDTHLRSIENISGIFPNLQCVNFNDDKYLTDITPLLDYNRGFDGMVQLNRSGVDEDMEHIIKTIQELGTIIEIKDAQIEKSKKEKLASQVIIPKGITSYNGIKKLFFYGRGIEPENLDEVEITQLDIKEKLLYNPTVSPEDLHYLLEFPMIAEMITDLRIAIPEHFGMIDDKEESFEQIVKDIDALKKPEKGGRRTTFLITKIPEVFGKDKDLLSARYGLNFSYDVPISQGYIDYHSGNRNYRKNIHIDELIDIRTILNELLQGIDDNITVKEKVNTVFSIMQNNFTLIQEELKPDIEEFSLLKGSCHISTTEEIRANNYILNALKSKIVTPQSYICIANELLKSLGVDKMQNEIELDNGLTEPEIRISISENEYMVINGKKGVEEKKGVPTKNVQMNGVFFDKSTNDIFVL